MCAGPKNILSEIIPKSSISFYDVYFNMQQESDHGNKRPDQFQHSIPIPAHKVGWIVGKNGSYIRQLSEKSGANVVISDSESTEFGTTRKYVQILGTGREVDRAKKLLFIRLDRYGRQDFHPQHSQTSEMDSAPWPAPTLGDAVGIDDATGASSNTSTLKWSPGKRK